MASLANVEHKNQDATVYVGNLDQSCDEPLLLELFTQVGRVSSVHMPKDKLTSTHNGYGFVEFADVADAEYAMQVMNMVKLFGKPIRVSKSSLDKKASQNSLDVGANLFIGNLDPEEVDEKLLYDTFSSFGTIIKPPKIMRDDLTNQSKGFGFVSFDSFEASDMAIACMNNQYLCNRQIMVEYAFKSTTNSEEMGQAPGATRERHGSRAERMLAANNPMRKYLKTTSTSVAPAVPVPSLMAQRTLLGNSTGLGSAAMSSMPPLPPPPLPPPPPPPLPVIAGTGSNSIPPPPPMTTASANISSLMSRSTVLPPPPPPPPPPPLLSTTSSSSALGVSMSSSLSHPTTSFMMNPSQPSSVPPPPMPPPPPPPLPPTA